MQPNHKSKVVEVFKYPNMALRIYMYEGAQVSFNSDNGIMANASEMAKPFGKQPSDWTKTAYAQEYIKTLSKRKNVGFEKLVITTRGNGGGTWFHEDVAMEFARWLSPDFGIWCNDRIKELLKIGVTAINPEDLLTPDIMIRAMEALKASRANEARLAGINTILESEIKTLAPKAEVFDKVMSSEGLMNTTEVGQNLGMSAVSLNKKLAALKIQRRMDDGT